MYGAAATACKHAAQRDGYQRRRPEQTALYQCVAANWEAFAEHMEQVGGLPRFVREEFEQYLRCGLLEHGCLELSCRSCGHSELVAFSCKRRGFCPGCLGRRMSDGAVHLEQEVLPEVPLRHWVCTFPWGVRALLGFDKALCREAARAFVSELSRSLRQRAKQELGLESMKQSLTGAVAVVQRTDGALRLNVHLHVLALDGVYVRDAAGALEFQALPAPSRTEVAEINGLSGTVGGVASLGVIGNEEDAMWKSVTGHEMGHQVQQKLGYQIGTNYASGNHTGNQPLCKCDHVEFEIDKQHCLQSQEHTSSAQAEGFAHFFATTLVNEWSHPIIVYGYYKRAFLTSAVNGSDWRPIPFFVDAKLRPRWLDTRCNTGGGNSIVNKGTEMDWFGMYFHMFSAVSDFWGFTQKWPEVYKTACGGNCSTQPLITWTALNNAVTANYGSGTERHEFFTETSDEFGVSH